MVEISEVEHARVQLRRGKVVVALGNRQDFQWLVVALRTLHRIIVGISEGERIRDFQVASHAGDVDLQAGVVSFPTFDLKSEHTASSESADDQDLIGRLVRKAFAGFDQSARKDDERDSRSTNSRADK